ncbi:MAG TPA: ABC transporter permease [Rhodothermales bacterium]|nr:ABC transporter permease [Rhodothermales bacterium]
MWPWHRRSDEDFAEEMHEHIRRETKRLGDDEGLNFVDARAKAIRAFGNVTATRERFYESRRLLWFDDLRRDLSYAVRALRRSPGFAVTAVLTLALGIGATTAIYSVVDTILLEPLPFAEADRLVRVVENDVLGLTGRVVQRGVHYQEWRARTTTLTDFIAVSQSIPALVATEDGTKRLWGARISGHAFAVLGVNAMLGRTLQPDDERDPHVVALGFEAWRRLFRSDPKVVGRHLELRGNVPQPPLTVVGVLPPGFEFPTGPMDYYRPFDSSRPPVQIPVVARLRDGVSLSAAKDEANAIGTAIRPARPGNAPPLPVPRFDVQPLKDEVVKELRPALRVLLAAVVVVLVIVCVNVANLLLVRGTARRREIAVRAAIGASRSRIIRQALAECLVLAGAGGALGALLASGGVLLVKYLAAVEAPGIFQLMFGSTILPRGHEVGVDPSVFGIAFGVAAAACVAFGLLPAVRLSQPRLTHTIGSRTRTVRPGDARVQSVLVVSQLVMATVLLVAAGLLINSFVRLTTVEKGYDASNVLALQLVFPGDYATVRKTEAIEELLRRARSHPNVEAAGFSRAGVFIGEEITYGTFVPRGRTLEEMRANPDRPRLRSVTEGFLPAMGIPFIAGRDITAADSGSASPGLVINRRAATLLFGNRSPVGEFVDWQFDKFLIQARVVGVVEELRNESLDQEPFPEVFVHYRQLLDVVQRLKLPVPQQDQTALGLLSFAVRTRTDPDSMRPVLAQIVRSVDANAGIDAIIPLQRLVASSVARQRFYAVLLAVFAAIAGILAIVGVYGVLAYTVAQRTQEIGIRMALGAQPQQVLGLVIRRGLLLACTGIALGLMGAVAGSRVLQGMLFGITPLDRTTFLGVSILFGLVTLCASYLPARRATTVNPVVALRTE